MGIQRKKGSNLVEELRLLPGDNAFKGRAGLQEGRANGGRTLTAKPKKSNGDDPGEGF